MYFVDTSRIILLLHIICFIQPEMKILVERQLKIFLKCLSRIKMVYCMCIISAWLVFNCGLLGRFFPFRRFGREQKWKQTSSFSLRASYSNFISLVELYHEFILSFARANAEIFSRLVINDNLGIRPSFLVFCVQFRDGCLENLSQTNDKWRIVCLPFVSTMLHYQLSNSPFVDQLHPFLMTNTTN